MAPAPAILAQAILPYGAVELVEWHWPSPLDITVCEDRHFIEMSLPPYATEGMVAFPDVAPNRFSNIGSLFLRPAHVRLRARSPGGHIRVVRLAIEPDAGRLAPQLALDDSILMCGLDLRDEAPRFLLRRIRDELLRPGPLSAEVMRAYADALMIETLRSVDARARKPITHARLAEWQHRRVMTRMEAVGAPPTVAELAGLCGISVRHFTRLYRALTGENPTQSIARLRAGRAAAMLTEGDTPIKVIAAESGFADGAAFATAFRRATGMTPRAYRQSLAAHRQLTTRG